MGNEAFLLIFPGAIRAGRSWHLLRAAAAASTSDGEVIARGCRGFVGPVPLPLWMSVLFGCAAIFDTAAARAQSGE